MTIFGQGYMYICAILMEIHIPQTEAVANSAALSSWTKYWEVLSHPTTQWSRSSIREIREIIKQDIFCSSTYQHFVLGKYYPILQRQNHDPLLEEQDYLRWI